MNNMKSSQWRLLLVMVAALFATTLAKAASHCYFVCPDDWQTPYVWAWDDNEVKCCTNTVWPGDQMTLVNAETRLYRWDAPEGKTPTMVIIHDNKGNHRMVGENTLTGKEKDGDTPFIDGVTYQADSSYEIISYPIGDPDPQPTPEPDPEPASEQFCYFILPASWSTPCVWAWSDTNGNCCADPNWPGDQMKLVDASKRLYRWIAPEGKVPDWVIIVDKADQKNNRMKGDNSVGDGDTPFVNGATYQVDSSYEIISWSISDPDPDPDPDPQPTPDAEIYCYFVNSGNWSNVYVHAWDETGSACYNTSWPGDQMQLVDTDRKLYLWTAPAGRYPTWIIIHDNGSNRMKGENSVAGSGGQNGDTPFLNGVTYYPDSTHDGEEIPVNRPGSTAGAVSSWSDDGTTVTIECESASLFITPYADKIVKVFTLPVGSTEPERRSITVSAAPSVSYTVNETDDAVEINVASTTVVNVAKENGLISFFDGKGNLKLREENYLRNLQSNHSVKFASMNDAAFFGAGYNGKNGNIKGRSLRIDNTQTGGWGADVFDYPHCIAMPFVASTSGYGVLFDDHWRGAVMSPLATGLTYTSGAQNPISYYFIDGDNLDDVVSNYTILTGRQDLPPYWALGYITSRYGYHNETEAQGYIDAIKDAGLPLDGIVFDLFWEGSDESGMGNLDWYTPSFPDAKGMMKRWHDRGINTVLITEPFFTSRCANYNTIVDNGYSADDDVSTMEWLRSPKVALLDSSNPAALDWMWTFYRDRIKEGVTGWWMDLGEPEQHDADSHHMGGSVDQVHNEFGQLWIERIYNGIREEFPEMRPFLMPRSGTSGMQRFSTFPWTGDINRSWGGLQAQVPALINMAMSGVSYLGSDVGGFTAQSTNPTLYLRWVEFAVFSPMMRTHSPYKPEPTQPEYSGVLPDVKKFINLRYKFLPYTYTLSYLNTTQGLPMARPACALDADPTVLADCKDAYLWGKDLYVAPVLADQTSRSITFPDGQWIDLNDYSKTYAGGETVNYSAPLDKLPYFMRRGSFIPMFTKSEDFGSTSATSYDDLTVLHSVDLTKAGVNTGLIYEDDRTSASSLENEEYALLQLRSETDGQGTMEVVCSPVIGNSSAFMPETRTIHFHIIGYDGEHAPKINIVNEVAPAVHILADNEIEVAEKSSIDEVKAHAGHAYFRPNDNEIYVKAIVPATSTVHLGLGRDSSSVDATFADADVTTLEYVDGMINYAVDSAARSAVIEFIALDGRVIATTGALNADGFVHSVAAPAVPGFCIARMTVTGQNGNVEKSIKFVK